MHFKIQINSAQPVAEVRVSASEGLNNQLQSCLLNSGIAWQIADKVVVEFTIRKNIYNGNYLMTQ